MKNLLSIYLLFGFLIIPMTYAQNRAILHFRADGQQELVPIKNNEKIKDVVDRLHVQKKSNRVKRESDHLEWQDTLRYYREEEMRDMFCFDPLDVAFQWYEIEVDVEILEYWWRREDDYTGTKSAQIRIWDVDKRIFDLPNTAVNATGHLGYYDIDCDSCDYTTTPFREESNSILHTMSGIDTTHLYFDPLRSERPSARTDVSVDSNGWQRVVFGTEGQSNIWFSEREPFGFTIQNTTPKTQADSSFRILSMILTDYDSTEYFNPYRSIKFYTYPFKVDSTIGWKIRNYELGTYVVVSFSWGGYFVTFDFLGGDATLSAEAEKKITAVFDDHYEYMGSHPEFIVEEAYLNYKIGHSPVYTKIPMTVNDDTLSAVVPPMSTNKKLYMYAEIFNAHGIRISSNIESINLVTSIETESASLWSFKLDQNFPNPFNPKTIINYELQITSDVQLFIYNILGQVVATLVSGRQAPAKYQVEWDASGFSSGIYYYKLVASDFIETRKMVLLK